MLCASQDVQLQLSDAAESTAHKDDDSPVTCADFGEQVLPWHQAGAPHSCRAPGHQTLLPPANGGSDVHAAAQAAVAWVLSRSPQACQHGRLSMVAEEDSAALRCAAALCRPPLKAHREVQPAPRQERGAQKWASVPTQLHTACLLRPPIASQAAVGPGDAAARHASRQPGAAARLCGAAAGSRRTTCPPSNTHARGRARAHRSAALPTLEALAARHGSMAVQRRTTRVCMRWRWRAAQTWAGRRAAPRAATGCWTRLTAPRAL